MTSHEQPFVSMAREYISLIDRCERSSAHELLSACARLLPRLYAAGIELPNPEPESADVDRPDLPSPTSKLMKLFGGYDQYYEVFDPVLEDDSIPASLADDLGDVYLELARPLAGYESGSTADAIWEWRFGMQGHCGDHLTDALRVIHRLIHRHMPSDYEAQPGDVEQG